MVEFWGNHDLNRVGRRGFREILKILLKIDSKVDQIWKTDFQKCSRNLSWENIFLKFLFWVIINILWHIGIQYNGLELFLDGREKIQTRLRRLSQKKQDSREKLEIQVYRPWKIMILPKFDHLSWARSPSSRGVKLFRSSDYIRCKGLNVIFNKNKKTFGKTVSQT